MVETVQGIGKVGRVCPDLGNNLRGGGTGDPDVWVRDVGDETIHWEYDDNIPPQVACRLTG